MRESIKHNEKDIRSLAKVGLATEITEKKSFKSFFSKVSVHSVAVALTYARGQLIPTWVNF